MIKFNMIRWKNFLSTGNIFTEVQLNQHKTTLIVGENGAGKSTILDALCFVLFGKSFRRINLDQLTNSINKRDTVVEIEFVIGKSNYRVIRGRNPVIFEIYCNDKLIDQTSKKDYQDLLENTILKMNYNSFTQIVILGSSTFVPFMQLTAQQRRSVVEDLLDIKIFSTMNILLKENIQSNKDNINEVRSLITIENEKKTLQLEYINEIKKSDDSRKQEILNHIKEITADITEIEKNIKAHEVIQKELLYTISDEKKVIQKEKKINKLVQQIITKKESISKDLEFYENNDACPTCTQLIPKDVVQNIVKEKLAAIYEIDDGLQKINEQLNSISERLGEIEKTKSEISKSMKHSSDLNVKLENNKIYLRKLNSMLKRIENVTNVNDAKNKIIEIENKISELNETLKKYMKEKDVLDLAGELLKDKGIKTRIIRKYVPIMNKLINKYLASMEFFVQFELDENFNEKIKSRFRDDFSYTSFSEGEKKRLDLALLMTWRAVAQLKNSSHTNLLILDEIFDASMDSSGCEEFMKLLQNLDEHVNVYVISHSHNINSDKFANKIMFEKYKNFSRISAGVN